MVLDSVPSGLQRLGTPLSSTINLAATAMGTGMLTLPFAFAQCGLASFLAILAVLAVTTDLSLLLLVRTGRATGLTAIGGIMQQIFGSFGRVSFQLMLIAVLFLALTAMQRVVLDLLPMFLEEVLAMTRGSLEPMVVSVFVNLGVLAVCTSDTFHELRFSSGVALACLFPFVCAIFWKALGVMLDMEISPRPVGDGTFAGLMLAPPLLASSLCCHFGILDLDVEMQPRLREHIFSVIHWVSLVILPGTYGLVALAGVAVLGADTGENVLMSFEGDRLMQLARGVLSLTNALRMPLMVKPLHKFVQELCGSSNATGADSGFALAGVAAVAKTHKLAGVAVLLVLSMWLAQRMLVLTRVLSLLGGTAGVLGCYCLPGLMYLGLQPSGVATTASLRAGAVLVIVVGALVVTAQCLTL